VRKSEKTDFEILWGGEERLNDFYRVFAQNMRDLGTPVFSRRLFSEILRAFPHSAEICVVRLEGKPVASGLLLHGAERTQVPSASTLRAVNPLNANYRLYYNLFVRAIERGNRLFDMGRSSEGSGTYVFKMQWRGTPVPSVWQYFSEHAELGDVRVDNPKYRTAIAVWKRLPVWLTRLVGPAIVRGIP
jgi:FemAB-related protein (PEP-CTERM system-associated)